MTISQVHFSLTTSYLIMNNNDDFDCSTLLSWTTITIILSYYNLVILHSACCLLSLYMTFKTTLLKIQKDIDLYRTMLTQTTTLNVFFLTSILFTQVFGWVYMCTYACVYIHMDAEVNSNCSTLLKMTPHCCRTSRVWLDLLASKFQGHLCLSLTRLEIQIHAPYPEFLILFQVSNIGLHAVNKLFTNQLSLIQLLLY